MHHAVRALFLFIAACGNAGWKPAPPPAPAPGPDSPPDDEDAAVPPEGLPPDEEEPPPEPRVVLVVVDGLRADLAATLPAWKGLAADGAWTLEARTERLPVTVVSHAAIFTGVGAERNGVASFEPGGDLSAWRPLKVQDTVFTAGGDAGMGTLAVIRKTKLRGLLPEEAVDEVVFAKSDAAAAAVACARLVDDDAVRLAYVHLADVDAAGHAKGWMSKAQKAAAVRVSDRLEEIRDCAVRAELAWKEPVYLLVTSDHGGHGRGHGKDVDDDRFVPWVLVGPGVPAGLELPKPVRLIDTAAVILAILGLPDGIPGLEGKIPDGAFEP